MLVLFSIHAGIRRLHGNAKPHGHAMEDRGIDVWDRDPSRHKTLLDQNRKCSKIHLGAMALRCRVSSDRNCLQHLELLIDLRKAGLSDQQFARGFVEQDSKPILFGLLRLCLLQEVGLP